jgi:hypothetical protein
MSQKPNSDKPPQAFASKPRTAYSTHPRVQKAFRRLVSWKKYEESQRTLAKQNQAPEKRELALPKEPEYRSREGRTRRADRRAGARFGCTVFDCLSFKTELLESGITAYNHDAVLAQPTP